VKELERKKEKHRKERKTERRVFKYYATGGFMYKRDRKLPISL
jgi:hypothetical protein